MITRVINRLIRLYKIYILKDKFLNFNAYISKDLNENIS